MARISINKASLDFNISRNTLYKHIKQGKITKDADGKLDTSDLIRLYGTHVNGQQESTTQAVTSSQWNVGKPVAAADIGFKAGQRKSVQSAKSETYRG